MKEDQAICVITISVEMIIMVLEKNGQSQLNKICELARLHNI